MRKVEVESVFIATVIGLGAFRSLSGFWPRKPQNQGLVI